jgi:hypothetical protein
VLAAASTVTVVAVLDTTEPIRLNAPVPVSIIYNLSPVFTDDVIVKLNVRTNVAYVVTTPIP